MNEFTINVVQDPSKIININNLDQAVSLSVIQDQETLIQVQDDINNVLLNPSVFYNGINIVYLSGVSGELLHNTFGDLQGGTTGQYYHLSSGQYFNLITGTGSFYPNNNPSGFITGVDLSPYATITYMTGISGQLQAQITVLNNQTGSFYPRSNPSGYITGINNIVYTTGDQIISGAKTFTSAPTFIDTTVRDLFINSSLGASENADPGSLVLRSNAGYSRFSSVISIVGLDSANYNHNKITQSIDGEPTVAYDYYFPQANGTLALDSTAVMLQGNQTVNGVKNFTSTPTVNNTGVLLSGGSYITGISGSLQTQITTLNNQTGSYYPRTNPSGYTATGYVTGISGGLQIQISTLNNQTGSYILNTQTGNFITTSQTGQFYASSNPSGFITGVNLSSYATQVYVTGISGSLQTQITNLNNSTGSYVLNSETGQFYLNTNPSGYITGIDLSNYVTGNVVRPSETGVFVTQSQTGVFYPASNPSGFITGIDPSFYSTTENSNNIIGLSIFL